MGKQRTAQTELGTQRSLLSRIRGGVASWRCPTGLHVAFLGADGSGKSSVIREIAGHPGGVFSSTEVAHLAPMLFRRRRIFDATDPHGQPARSLPVSIAKALWWLFDYTAGYYVKVWPALVGSRLVLYDRYMVDVLVDPKRYRYGGPSWLPRLIWRVVPKPDLVIVLDAPARVLRARKQEITLDETERQQSAYCALAAGMRNGRVVDASKPLPEVIDDVRAVLVEFLAARATKRPFSAAT